MIFARELPSLFIVEFVCLFFLFVSSEKLLRPFSLPKSQKKAQKDSQRDQNPAKT